jgi:glycosyltransferase involved in cell wall biosynthesis
MKTKVARVVTAPEVVEYHLRNTLNELTKHPQFSLEIIGTGVSLYKDRWPHVQFTDIRIERKIHLVHDVIALIKLTKHFSKTKPDIVHSIMPKSGLIAAMAGFLARVPIRIHTFGGQIWANKSGLKRKFFVSLDKLVVALNSACLTDSPSQSQFLLENGVGCAGNPIPVLGKGSLSGVDLKKFDPLKFQHEAKKIRQSYGINDQDVVFVFVGRKLKDKGVFELIEAFSRLNRKKKNCYLLLVGPEDSLEFTEYFKTAPKDHVISVGHTPTPEIYMACADIFVLPSYREGFGTVAIEAAAMGLPTIATKIPGLVDAVEENITGVLVAMKDAESLEKAMEQLLVDSALRKKLGQAGQDRVKKYFSSEKLAADLFNFYRKLMPERMDKQD